MPHSSGIGLLVVLRHPSGHIATPTAVRSSSTSVKKSCFETPPPTPKFHFGVSDSRRFMRPFGPLNLVRCLNLLLCLDIQKRSTSYRSASLLNQRLPILPGGLPPSTFGVCGLNCCVRHGNRWIPAAIATELFQDSYPDNCIKMFVLTTL